MKFLLDYKIFESVQQAKSILKELEISEEDKDYQTIRNLFRGSEGYVGWFTKMRNSVQKVSYRYFFEY